MGEPMARLSDLSVKALKAPLTGQVTHLDDQILGFGVRVSQGGSKTFVLTYGKERRRLTIGRYPVISLAQARDIAKKHLAELTLGTGHAAPPASVSVALKDLVERFLAEKRELLRPRTFGDYKRLLERHITFDADVTAVTAQKLEAVFKKVTASQERAHLINVTKMLFGFAERREYITRSPARGFKVNMSRPRERVLNPAELRAIWHACSDGAFGTSVKLLIVTGQRRGEIQHLTLDDDLAAISSLFTKNHRSHTFPVGPIGSALLGEDRAFSGWGKAKAQLDRKIGLSDWTLHDLRRTYATIHAQLGTPPHIIEALLNHKSGIISGVAATYNRFQYLDEMRLATARYEEQLLKIIQ